MPNKHNVLKAVEFFQANPFTLLIIAFVAAILQFKHAFWLLVVYLLFCYLYPLVTRSKKLVIDRKVETIISSRDQSINERGQHNGNPKIQDFLFGRYITKVVAWQNSNVSKSDAEESKHHGKVRVKHQPFNYNVELLVGIILSPIGLILQLSGSDGATDRINQLQSVLQNRTLDGSGYIYIWGYLALRIGLLALVGGLVKGFIHKANSGITLKAIAVLAGVATAAVTSYVYAHPFASAVDAARMAYDSGASLDDISNIVQMVKYLPFVVIGIYALGIFVNLLGQNCEYEE